MTACSRGSLRIALVLLLSVASVSWADQAMPDEHAAHRAAMNTLRYTVSDVRYDIPDVQLIDASGSSVALQSILDSEQPVALNFIFTTCTTICPVMTVTFAQMQRELGEAAKQLRLVSISIDPEYDRPEVLKAYAEQFHVGAGWTFLTGDSDDISQVLRSFDSYAGSKMNHQPLTLLKRPENSSWVRIDGLAGGADLAQEVTARLLN
jgi:protein SCO1/2